MSNRMSIVLLATVLGCAKKTPETPTPEPAPAPSAATPAPAPAAPAADPQADYGPVVDAVLFNSGGTVIAADQVGAIDKAAEVLKGSDWKVIVVGLADATGDAEANKVISQQRADTVVAELRKRVELADDRVMAVGIGEKLATGATQSERKVEFVFYHDKGLPPRQVVMRSGVLESDFRAKRAAAQEAPKP